MKSTRRSILHSFLATLAAGVGFTLAAGLAQAATETFSTAGTTPWTCPPGITSIKVECWGAGGAGGAARCTSTGTTSAGGGGGGGAYIVATEVAVTPGNIYTITVGAGGTSSGGASTSGAASSIDTLVPVSANGGTNGVSVATNNTFGSGGAGGTAGTFAGGNGARGATTKGGGGGGSAGTGSAGNYTAAITVVNNIGATAVTGGGAGGNGAGSGGSTVTGSGGAFPGGGGGGAASNSTTQRSGGAGARGQVVLTYFPTYYSQGSLDATLTTNWNSLPAGGGTSPADFTGAVFVIQNNHSMTTSAAWTISGTDSGLTIRNGGTLTATFVVDAPAFEMDSGGSYVQNVAGYTGDFPGSSTRTLDANSTVTLLTWGAAPIPAISYGNLTLDYASGVTLGGGTTVRGLLTLTSGALSIGANTLTLNGTVSTTGGSLTGGVTSSITCGGSSAITLPAVAGGLNNLTANCSGGVALGGAISLGGTSPALLLTAGAVTGGGNLTLVGGTTITRTAGTLDVAPTFSGTVDVIYNSTATTQTTGPELPTSGSALNNLTFNITSGKTINLNASATLTGTLTLTGGKLNMGSSSITGGTLAVTGNSTLALGSGTLNFANSSAVAWTGTLTLTVRLGATTLRFGTDASGLDTAQVDGIIVSGSTDVIITPQGYIQALFPADLLFFENFDGNSTTELNNTTPDITTGGANWVAMNAGTTGSVYAEGTLDVSGGSSATRGGSATLAFTPQNGFVYTLDLSARNLNSAASFSTAERLNFGFGKGQSSGNGTGTRFGPSDATVQGQVIEGYMTKPAYTGAAGIANRTYNDIASAEWLALTTAYGGNIDMRIVLDTSGANWTATWYAKLTGDAVYSVTRATETVTDTDITSVGFGLNQNTSGRISSFSLSATGSGPGNGYGSWQNANSTNQTIDLDHDNDGVSNGVEFFLGGSTDTTGFTALPGVTNTAGTLSVTWTKGATYLGIYGTDFWVETSATLSGAWATETSGVTVTFPSATEVKYTFPAGTKNFARLKVTGP